MTYGFECDLETNYLLTNFPTNLNLSTANYAQYTLSTNFLSPKLTSSDTSLEIQPFFPSISIQPLEGLLPSINTTINSPIPSYQESNSFEHVQTPHHNHLIQMDSVSTERASSIMPSTSMVQARNENRNRTIPAITHNFNEESIYISDSHEPLIAYQANSQSRLTPTISLRTFPSIQNLQPPQKTCTHHGCQKKVFKRFNKCM
jgi:hypothetical protein